MCVSVCVCVCVCVSVCVSESVCVCYGVQGVCVSLMCVSWCCRECVSNLCVMVLQGVCVSLMCVLWCCREWCVSNVCCGAAAGSVCV